MRAGKNIQRAFAAVDPGWQNVPAIDGESVVLDAAAIDTELDAPLHADQSLILAALIADARGESQHADEIAPVERRLLRLLRGDDLVPLRLFRFDMANTLADNLDFLGTCCRWFERAVHFNFLVGGENQIVGREILETLGRNLERVGSRSGVDEVLTLRIAGGGLSCARSTRKRDGCTGKHSARLVGDGAVDLNFSLFMRGRFDRSSGLRRLCAGPLRAGWRLRNLHRRRNQIRPDWFLRQ